MSAPRPTSHQIEAADPARSNWVGANAGSGKTHVLSQRVARLLLTGAAPERILCLTYTKAAAAEMQNRLFRLLGDWAMLSDRALGEALAGLTGGGQNIDDPGLLADARRLFARALETPGGLKIQTIHAFCDSLLRRFPLEAAVSPRFDVADDRQFAQVHQTIRADMARVAEDAGDPAFDAAAARLNEADVDGLMRAVISRRDQFTDDTRARIAAHFGVADGRTRGEIAALALGALEWDLLDPFIDAMQAEKGAQQHLIAQALRFARETGESHPTDAVAGLLATVLTKEGRARKTGFPTKPLCKAFPGAEGMAAELSDWAIETRQWLLAAEMAARTHDLHDFAAPLIARYQDAKSARGLLDFDDLIVRVHALLTRSDMAAWVLYKLDQGIDHVLIDEAQDTAPRQWEVIAALIDEFHAGQGARSIARSVFVVGDEKQSIYSFQGADPQAFGRMRQRIGQRLEEVGTPLGRPDLRTSFRSAPAILDFVDAVFEGPNARGLMVDDEAVIHRAHRTGDQGRVDLWPLVEPEPTPEEPEWWRPVDAPLPGDAKMILADQIARNIHAMVGSARLPAREGQPGRIVEASDILVLVAHRDRLAQGIIRGLKSLGVPVAGADRLRLTREIAVMDLMAMIRFVTDPGDDLSLAAVLRSPLCDVDEAALFALAHPRTDSLWQALRQSEHHPREREMLGDLLAQADFLRPYEFLERLLRQHDGRRRLLARLGDEAEDAIDELLNQALIYEGRDIPTLAGFSAWIDQGDVQIKREMDTGAGDVRVMTVHGAKGLEAPIVILPDTLYLPGGNRGPNLLQLPETGNAGPLTVWAGPARQDDEMTAAARAAAREREAEERRRLLYVALTRAEDWLILCGAGRSSRLNGTWYQALSETMARMPDTREVAVPGLPYPIRRFETGPTATAPAAMPSTPPAMVRSSRPAWLGPAPVEAAPAPLTPSSLKSDAPRSGTGRGREAALRHGNSVHMLLERLSPHAPDQWPFLGETLLSRGFPELSPDQRRLAIDEALAVRNLPDAAPFFGPEAQAEQPLVINIEGWPVMRGIVDRLVRVGNEVRIVDFKTDTAPAATPPAGYVAQLALYRRAVSDIYPDHEVRAGILWTALPRLDWIDAELLTAAAADAFGSS